MYSKTEENYLKALFNLAGKNGEVNVNELGKKLNIKMPTVNSMVKKLAEKKLVHYESYKPVRLTEKGKKAAALIIRKHRLTEMYLVEKMGFGWEEVHEIAEQLEHIQSPELFEKMDELLGFPGVDPHGSPIPDKNGKITWPKSSRLSEVPAGTVVTLTAVADSSDEFLKFLNSRELKLGIKLTVTAIENFDGTMTVHYHQHKGVTLSRVVCDKLLVAAV
ncbi:metal-dependent transcriptional regulator [Chitinophaga nivalis]|uniref:Transcriptional regulator MntR n=1 Tax=Chitinophaga nivalis TaxID=2991709 RepID=A0ABT3IPG3_9BACT|nr:metal-dependent transcriptional regulator [Chitinophaga nivalis]MCW3464528.1 metal-dependent transcriptional regulator [Chitinophaga nivalis]MCW3485781.1 metal-dependent transcriptional regulator [Chitinophaga nivalis]